MGCRDSFARPACVYSSHTVMPASQPLAEILARLTGPGELYTRLPDRRVRCHACGHLCTIVPGKEGICRVRFNLDGTLLVPRGYVAGLAVDPIEKKPFFHAFPGGNALSFGMLGCDYHCAYCQNWLTSQALRDPAPLRLRTHLRPGDRAPAVHHAPQSLQAPTTSR